MKIALHRIILVILLFITTNQLFSQQILYSVDANTFFDNLEGSVPYADTRTVTGLTITPTVGIKNGNHSFVAGVFLYKQFGTDSFSTKVDLRAHYEYQDQQFRILAGSFSIDELNSSYPDSFFRTDYSYINNSLHGFMGQYKKETGYLEFCLDWYKSDLPNRVDGFLILTSGEKWFNAVRLSGHVSYNHRADKTYFIDFNVADRFQYDLSIGYEFAKHQNIFNSIMLTAGVVGDADRRRNEENKGFERGIGFETQQKIDYKGLFIENILYMGEPQMRYYPEYGESLYTGSPFYQSSFMDKFTFGYRYNYKVLSFGADFIVYFTEKSTVMQQLLTVRFSFGGKSKINKE